VIITWSDWQQRLELDEPPLELTAEQHAEIARRVRRMSDDIERCMLGLPPLDRD
jgi:hypothetical protein